MVKKYVAVMIVLFMLFSSVCFGESVTGEGMAENLPESLIDISGKGTLPNIVGETAILIDAQSGQILFNKDMHAQRYPASTTKVITGLLAIENLELGQTVVVDREASFTSGSRVYLIEDEEVTVQELMYALMLESANDAAIALGKTISGNVDDFAALMNQRAAELGALNTNFTNSNGLPDENHVTTAYDLAMMGKKGLEYPDFRHFVTTVSYTMAPTNKQPERIFNNSNRLLFDQSRKFDYDGTLVYAKYEGATGIKTGYTKAAGSCLVASAERNGRELIAVVMKSNSEQIFVDAIKLFDYGFTYYDGKRIIEDGQLLDSVKVKKGAQREVDIVAQGIVSLTIPVGSEWGKIETKLDLPKSLTAPIVTGQKIGSATIYQNGVAIGSVDAVAKEEIITAAAAKELRAAQEGLGAKILRVLKMIGIGILALIVAFVAFVCTLNYLYYRKKKKRKKARASAEKEVEKAERKVKK